jgi:hypothetical protein
MAVSKKKKIINRFTFAVKPELVGWFWFDGA